MSVRPFDNVEALVQGIAAFPSDTAPIGRFAPSTLRMLADLAGQMRVRRSAETGLGTATLLLSQVSENHVCFTTKDPRSYVPELVASPWLRQDSVEFIVGPSQRTLPRYEFGGQLDFALIDGPHAHPFPDIDYFCFYQQLAAGAVLVINNIVIPTIRNLFHFLNDEPMFSLIGVDGKTAFYRRTSHPTFDPTCDGWLHQAYNIKSVPAELRQYV